MVVDGSNDGSAVALRELETPFSLTVLEQADRAGAAAARNRGAAVARGELLLFLDDDMEAHPRLLAEHERSHREGADVVLGHIPLHPESPASFLAAAVGSWAERRRERIEGNGRLEPDDLLTGQLSLRRETFELLGGFDSSFTRGGTFGGEDLDFGWRLIAAECDVAFNPDAIAWQQYVVTPRQYLRQWRDAGGGDVLLARKHPDRADHVFHRRQTISDRLVLRWIRWPLRELVLALARIRPQSSRVARWFFRVRNVEYFQGIHAAGGIPRPRAVRVLCYHSISDLAGAEVVEPYGIPPGRFRRELELLDRHFRVIGADEFGRFLRGAGVPRRAVLLTFDDCFRDLLEQALPALRERQMPAIAFAVTGRLGGENDWDAHLGAPRLRLLDAGGLRELAQAGIAVESHSRTHRVLNRASAEELSEEVNGSIADLESLGLGHPSFLAYPHGEHDLEVRRAAAAAGLAGAFTVEPGPARPGQDPFAIPRNEILRRDIGWRFLWKVVRAGR